MLGFVLAIALAQDFSGATLFDNHCAACHNGSDPRVPTVASITGSPDAGLVQQITSPKTFDFSLTGDQTSQSGYIVLDPPTDQTGSSGSGSSSSGSSSSSSGSSGSSSSSSATTTGSGP